MKRSYFVGLAVAAVFMTLVSCGGKSKETGTPFKVINIGVTNDPATINPLSVNNSMTRETSKLLFMPLTSINIDLGFTYRLAESITTEDNIHFIIKINPKVFWTDGKPVSADDLIYTFNMNTHPDGGAYNPGLYAGIVGTDTKGFNGGKELEGLRKIDDRTVEVTLKLPSSLTIFNMNISNETQAIPKHILVDVAPGKLKTHEFFLNPTVTNGPFIFKEYVGSQYISLNKNPNYFLGSPKIDQLNLKILNGSQITAQLESGEIDMNFPGVGNIPNDDWDRIRALSYIRTEPGVPATMNILFYNINRLNNLKLRQAMDLAIDRDNIVNNVLKGSAYTSRSPSSDQIKYWNSATAPYKYDPEAAKRLLQESGWNLSKEIHFVFPSGNVARERVCLIVAENFKAIGLNIVEERVDLPTSLSKIQGKVDYDIGVVGLPERPLHPIIGLQRVASKDGSWNNFTTPRLEEVIGVINTSINDDAVRDAYLEFQQIVAENVPASGLYAEKGLSAVNTRVIYGGLQERGPFLDTELWDIQVE
ncbi:ABC transporter substrate-binding protein [Spirochaetia bacterium]|nr:ABC transporter substrate-binding protein [Spirochaetia bacterium]